MSARDDLYRFAERGHGDITADRIEDADLGTVLWIQTSVDGCYIKADRVDEFANGLRSVARKPTPAPLPPERLAEYAALVQAATEGPWQVIVDPTDDGFPAGAVGVATEDETFVFAESVTDGVEILRADAKFTAAARTAVPELLAEVARLSALVAAMHAAAVGEVKPPLLGLVEDVTLTRDAYEAQQARADTLNRLARQHRARVTELEAELTRADVLPAWEAVYEPGNVSDYLIGYTNDECAAKAAAEAWLRSQRLDEPGRLEWVDDKQGLVVPYDQWFELIEHEDDGIPLGLGLIVRRRAEAGEFA